MLFWATLDAKHPLKEWDIVDYNNLVVYTGYVIGKVTKAGKPWYTIDMAIMTLLHSFLKRSTMAADQCQHQCHTWQS